MKKRTSSNPVALSIITTMGAALLFSEGCTTSPLVDCDDPTNCVALNILPNLAPAPEPQPEPQPGPGPEDPPEPPVEPDPTPAYYRFYEIEQNARADRVSDQAVGTTELSRSSPQEEMNGAGDRITEFTRAVYRTARDLTKLVMMDNTVGIIYPGSMLWAAAVRDGQLHQLETIPGRPPVTVTFSGVQAVQPAPPAIVFAHDGTYSDFMTHAAGVFANMNSSHTRLIADYRVSSSLEDALLSIGLSAYGWGASMSADLTHIRNERRSVAVMTLDQVFYSASMDSPQAEGILPSRLLLNDAQLAAGLARGAETGGEVAYVRKVDYGRRILVSLSANASSEELRLAVSAAGNWMSGGFRGSVDHRTRQVWQSVEGKFIIIGGSYPSGVSPFFGGDIESFGRTIQAITSESFVNDTRGAIPVSFELAYASDNAPMQVFETVEFAGRIPGRSWGKRVQRIAIFTDYNDADTVRHDDELGSDDWSMVELTSQALRLSPDRRAISLDLEWNAFEGEHTRTIRGDRTVIRSLKSINFLPYPKPVRSIVTSPTSYGARQEWYAGRQHDFVSFPNHGLLTDIRVRFDANGRQDHLVQRLDAFANFEIWIEE